MPAFGPLQFSSVLFGRLPLRPLPSFFGARPPFRAQLSFTMAISEKGISTADIRVILPLLVLA